MSPFTQVGGHASSITSTSSGQILNKPCSKTEKDFYTSLGKSNLFPGGFIGEWTPEFYGTLELKGRMKEDGDVERLQEGELEGQVREMLVLENVTHRFNKPNILDIKLGTQLYDEDASPEKRERMEKAAKATTSHETGVRLTGFQTWDEFTQTFVLTPKSFGKSIQPPQLLSAITKFFHPPSSTSYSSDDTIPSGLPLELLVPILNGILAKLEELESILEKMEIRIRGGSILIVIEGDATSLSEAVQRSGQEEDEDNSSVSTTDGEGNSKPFTRLPWDLRLIDFAHTRAAPGEGKDEGLLRGIRTTIMLIEQLRDKLEQRMEGGLDE